MAEPSPPKAPRLAGISVGEGGWRLAPMSAEQAACGVVPCLCSAVGGGMPGSDGESALLDLRATAAPDAPKAGAPAPVSLPHHTPPGLQWSQSGTAHKTLLADLMAAPLDGWSDQSKQKLAKAVGSPESLLCLVLHRRPDSLAPTVSQGTRK